MQWETDLIGYDAVKSYGSPAYYAQVMFGSYLGDHTLASKVEGGGPEVVLLDHRQRGEEAALPQAGERRVGIRSRLTSISPARNSRPQRSS